VPVAAVAAVLVLGLTAAGGVAYRYWKPADPPAVVEAPPAQPDAAPDGPAPQEPLGRAPDGSAARKQPAPPPPAERHEPERAPDNPAPPKLPAPKLPAPPQVAKLEARVLGDPENSLPLPGISSWALLPDGVTLVVALPDQARLAYVDTAAEKELKRVDLPFKPDRLAVQGKRLFASVQGASLVHVLDLDSGAGRKEIEVPGGFVMNMACHPERGPVYLVMSEQNTIYTLNPDSGSTAMAGFYGLVSLSFPAPHSPAIRARAQHLAVDPHNGNTFFGAYSNGFDKWHEGVHEQAYGQGLEKYRVRGKVEPYPGEMLGMRRVDSVPPGRFQPLERVGLNGSAVPVANEPGGFYPVRVSGDGKRVGVVGRGEILLLGADNINFRAGTAKRAAASDLAFHPVLDLMAVEAGNLGSGQDRWSELHFFNGKSLTHITQVNVNSGPLAGSPQGCRLLTFGARGTKLCYYDWLRGGRLCFFPLTLPRADRAVLANATHAEVRAFQVPGALEGESLKVVGKSGDFPVAPQDMTPFLVGQWSGDSQLFGRPTRAGAWADLELAAPADGKYRVVVYLTRSWDYGLIQFHVNGNRLGSPIDVFHGGTVVSTGPVDLREAVLKKGANTLRVEAVGTNPKSEPPHYSWGLDCVVLEQVK
jgi:hypothetical protein